ncbi:MAG: LicD family protein [Marinilabiliaceae bacterium]|nr:LicD family protein [Marinilabiliaceae bacterium]
MDEINAVQYEIFKSFHSVCERLKLKYYLVHGSLLGALRYQGFFPMDDDIDVAMPRKDYDVLMSQGQTLIDKKYFIQSHLSDKDYPLVFAKIRANDTAFIQPVLKNCKVHKGIYIDVFPIDNYPTDRIQQKKIKFKRAFLSRRVTSILNMEKTSTLKTKCIQVVLKVLIPSWRKAVAKFSDIYKNVSPTGFVVVRGGKKNEIGIPFELFGEPTKIKFEELVSYAPEKTEDYLQLIYGDYMHYEPMGKDMVSDNEVKISADIVDCHKSYKEYE